MVTKMAKKEIKKVAKEEDASEGEEEEAEKEEKDVEINESADLERLKKFKKQLESESAEERKISIKASKPIVHLKKGDKIKVDALVLEIDAHYVLIDHGKVKEMAIEAFDAKTDKDYQIRYFSDRVQETIEVYRLDEILYNKISFSKLEW